jgi:hypothetical protein
MFSFPFNARIKLKKKQESIWWLLCSVVFWLHTNVSEQHTAPIFRVEIRRITKCIVYLRLGSGSGQGYWPIGAMR